MPYALQLRPPDPAADSAGSEELVWDGPDGNVVRRTVLPSGVRILTEAMPGLLSASVGLWVGVGSRDEEPGHLGSTHFLEHLLFKGTARRSALQIAEAFDEVGGESNAATAKESTCYYARVLSEDLPLAIDVLTDMVTAPLLDSEELERERGVILEELAMDQDDPTDVAFERFVEHVLQGSALSRPIGGTPEEITGVARGRVLEHWQEHYRPDSLVVTAAGGLDHDRVVEEVRTCLSRAGWDPDAPGRPRARGSSVSSAAPPAPGVDDDPLRTVPPTRVHAALGRGARAAAARLGALPLWAQALLIWAAARLWSALVLVVIDRQAPDGPWGETPLGYFATASIWDGVWYERIHDDGYPASIPRDATGAAQENPWAFHPLFPLVVRAVTAVTGASWTVAAPLVALVAGFGAALAVAALFRRLAGPRDALWALAAVAFCAVSPVLQSAYAESLHLALLALALLLVVQGRFLAAAPVVLLMCLARPAGVPFAAALGIAWAVHALPQLREHGLRRLPRVLDRRLGLALWACLCALAWPAIAWAATGEPTAYTDTETAWRGGDLVPVEPWLQLGARLLGQGWGWLFVVVVVAVAALLLGTRAVRAVLPPAVLLWVAAYAVYLLLFLHPQSSTPRMLLPLFVLALPLVAVSDSRAYRWGLVVVGALSQIAWVGVLWQWSPLPGGGDYPP